MNKLKLFIEDFFVYGLGGIISKVIPLVVVPIVTRLMPSIEYFGISDLSNTVVSFASAFAIMGMYDAMYRLFFEKGEIEYKKKVCSTALSFTVATSIIVFFILIIFRNQIARYFFSDTKYTYIVYLSAMAALVSGTNTIISAPTRMQNKRKVFIVANTISPLLSYGIAIPMILAGYYTVALPLAAAVSGLMLEVSFWILNREWFGFKRFDKHLLKQLLTIGIPLLPNFLIYWVFNSCDKVMIVNVLGVGDSGIYSVASKLGQCSQLIYTAFAGGWQYFALSTMKEEMQVESNSLVFEYLGVLSFITTAFVCAWSHLLFRILFPQEYLSGYICAPYLFLAPLLQMLFQVSASQFLIIKKTWPNMFILGVGALVNVLINYYLIPRLGIEGASLATLLGYAMSDIVCVIVLCKMKLMIVTRKFVISLCFMVLFLLIWRFFFTVNTIISTILAFGVLGIYFIIYRNQIMEFVNELRKGRGE